MLWISNDGEWDYEIMWKHIDVIWHDDENYIRWNQMMKFWCIVYNDDENDDMMMLIWWWWYNDDENDDNDNDDDDDIDMMMII